MRSKFVFSWDRIHEIEFFGTFHEIEIPNNWFDFLISPFFMRSKLLIMVFRVSISWSFLWLTKKFDLMNSISWKMNFNLMKFEIEILGFDFRSHDQSVDLLINIIGQIRSHEQIEFRSHDQKFDLLKKLNFDLMKFDLMIISHQYANCVIICCVLIVNGFNFQCFAFQANKLSKRWSQECTWANSPDRLSILTKIKNWITEGIVSSFQPTW